jgi:hypothetical protein
MKTIPFLAVFILFTVIIAAPPAILGFSGNSQLLNAGFWSLFLFMSALTLAVLLLMLTVHAKNPDYFVQAFMGGTTFKILACLIFIMVFLARNSVNKFVFMGDFLYIYLLNTAFEIYVLLRNLRHQKLR